MSAFCSRLLVGGTSIPKCFGVSLPSRGWLLLQIVLLGATGPAVRAQAPQQPAAEPPAAAAPAAVQDDVQDPYRRLIDEAIGEFNRSNWGEAHALFARAHALRPNARTSRGLGLTCFEMRLYVDAIAHLQDALQQQELPLADWQRDEAKSVIERAQQYVGRVSIETVPPAAHVLLNGQLIDRRELTLNVGTYQVSATAAGYKEASASVLVEPTQTETVRLVLLAEDPAPELPSRPVRATSAPKSERMAQPSSPGTTQRLLGWTSTGVGVVGLTLGVVFQLQRAREVSQRDEICPTGLDCLLSEKERIDEHTRDARRAAAIGTVALVAGGIFVAGGLALVLTAPADREATEVTLAPIITPHVQGATLSLRGW